jgi:hypothetical protein
MRLLRYGAYTGDPKIEHTTQVKFDWKWDRLISRPPNIEKR